MSQLTPGADSGADQAALEAKQWVFEPSTFRGSPISVILVTTVTYALK